MTNFRILFDPNTWGTVADWLMVIVTMITAYYLYKTLKSQQEVQRMQAQLFEIEAVRFRESIKPELKYTLWNEDGINVNDKDKKVVTIQVTNESDSVAFEIEVDYSENKGVVPIKFATDYIFPGYLKKGERPLMYHFLVEADPIIRNYIIFAISYQDISGTKYKQSILGRHDKFGTDLNAFLPEVVKEVGASGTAGLTNKL